MGENERPSGETRNAQQHLEVPDPTVMHFEMFEAQGVTWPPNACSRCRRFFPPYMAGVPIEEADNFCWGHAIEDAIAPWKTLLGDLVDALHDELRYECGQSEHVLNHIEAACRELGEAYMGYVGNWL